ncbi:amidase/nitrilase [Rhodoglobus vestalii]|uniref:Amidase/nitrilase n=1 Tax=Rhodoglobus vestalii TaxID=193384 RepID=A0A8H2PXB1_9MICO|nr:carbon-nitrogen hydrolase family protein [Rhodoglobus vestalii]TQO20065.1 amidase/nitrilase [Rhodoglobus vestalii]
MATSKKVLGGNESIRIAIAQISPVFMDKERSLARAEKAIADAAADNADLVVFSEAWLSGYPYWTEGWDSGLQDWVAGRVAFRDSAVVIGTEDTERLSAAAAQHRIHLVMGCNELDADPASNTIYNTQLFFDGDGKLLGRHRKLMPTFGERQFWGQGQLTDLRVYDTDIGRIGGLICGEHLMPLVRAAMIELGEEIHVAAFPGSFVLHTGPRLEEPDLTGDAWRISSTRNHAFEAGAFVASASSIIDPADVPDGFPYKGKMNIDYATGGSSIISPLGVPLVEPTMGSQILVSDCEAWMIKAVKAIVDTAGHYSRPDLLALAVKGQSGWDVLNRDGQIPSGWGTSLLRSAEAHDVDPLLLPEAAQASISADS